MKEWEESGVWARLARTKKPLTNFFWREARKGRTVRMRPMIFSKKVLQEASACAKHPDETASTAHRERKRISMEARSHVSYTSRGWENIHSVRSCLNMRHGFRCVCLVLAICEGAYRGPQSKPKLLEVFMDPSG